MLHSGRALVLGIVCGCVVGCMPWAAAQPAAGPIRIAIVDTQKLVDDYARRDPKLAEIEQWASQQEAYLQDLQAKYSFLSEDNFSEVVEIMRMPRPLSARWAKRERELRELNDQKEARFLELQGKVDRTPQEQEEFNQIQEIYQLRQKQIETILADLNDQLKAKAADAQAAVRATIIQAVQDVAAEGKYDLVLSKSVVIFGGEDITDAVLRKLGGPAPAPPAAPAPAPGGAP